MNRAVLAMLACFSLLTAADTRPLPPFPEQAEWINSEPLTVEMLRGHVVLIEVWTFG